jgi:surface polysaccharide O-acyltransferase-like enzyme
MYKRLLLLNGLAIFAVVCNHAAGFGQVSLFLWADSYRPVVVPDWSQLGTVSHYFLLSIRQIASFCVPAFFFVSGFFVSYAALDKRNPLNFAFVWKRIKTLLIPYLFWSIVLIGGNILQGISHSPLEYLILILSTGVVQSFWFVPALCYCYLISPILVRLVEWNWKLILVISGLIQLIPVAINYLGYSGIDLPWIGFISKFSPTWSPFQWIFFFTFGISAGFHIQGFIKWLFKYKTLLFILVLLTGLLNILESDYLLRSTLENWGAYSGTITYNLYASSVILWFLALVVVPFSNQLARLGVRSYGIYLLHFPIIELSARIIHKFVPQLLAYPIVLVPLLVTVGLGLPLIFMSAFRKSPVKQYYQYLFS